MSVAAEFDDGAKAPVRAGWRLLAPFSLGLVGIVLMAAPAFTPAPVIPHLTLLIVSVWALYMPRLMPPMLALGLGAATDLALGLPLGVNATLLAAVAFVLARVESRGPPRPLWADWLLAGGLFAAYLWGVTELVALAGAPRPGGWLLPQLLTTWALAPAATRVSAWVYGKVIVTA